MSYYTIIYVLIEFTYIYHPYQLCHYYQFYLRDLLVTTINFVIFNTNIAIHCQLHAVHNYALNFITVECRDVHGLCHIIINCTAIVNWPVLAGHLIVTIDTSVCDVMHGHLVNLSIFFNLIIVCHSYRCNAKIIKWQK